MDKYYITAVIHPKPGKEEALKTAILQNIPNVRAEKGCLRYDLHVLKDGGAKFLFYEIWADKAAFEAHRVAPHMLAYREQAKDLLAAPSDVTLWSAADVTG